MHAKIEKLLTLIKAQDSTQTHSDTFDSLQTLLNKVNTHTYKWISK